MAIATEHVQQGHVTTDGCCQRHAVSQGVGRFKREIGGNKEMLSTALLASMAEEIMSGNTCVRPSSLHEGKPSIDYEHR